MPKQKTFIYTRFQIAGTLLPFTEEPVAVIGDIKAMFNQVNVPCDQSSSLKLAVG